MDSRKLIPISFVIDIVLIGLNFEQALQDAYVSTSTVLSTTYIVKTFETELERNDQNSVNS